jgi:glycosyltransferase involved in cell wall biosynthesis
MKKLMLICAPVTSQSGYGEHARDLVTSFLKHDKYDIKIQDVNWGATPRNALDINNSEDKKILDCILSNPEVEKKPDVYVDIRIPNEFQTYGNFNIGITAGIETTVVSQKWLEGCNKMDLIIVPSEHSKDGFVKTIYDKVDQNTNQKIGELKLEKPMEVLFEGANEDIYKPVENASLKYLNDIKEDFVFLFTGQWGQGGFGEDRKDISKLVKIFYESFANKKDKPALVMKTSGANFSILDKEECLEKIKKIKSLFPTDWELPNVYLLHGNLSAEEMNLLYNHPKVKCMVSFTHGEGFGRPLLEATMVGLPVVTSNWSGHLDFLDGEKSILVGGKLNKVPDSVVWQDIIIKSSEWFYINENQAYKSLNHAFKNHSETKDKAVELMKENREKFTLSKMVQKLDEIMENYLKDTPQQVNLNLPKLKKVSKASSEPPEVKLPKLKKITKEEVSV